MTSTRTPLIVAIVLLLLPMLYVASYLALVVPDGILEKGGRFHGRYRFGIERRAQWVYWPLEQAHRRLQPETWEGSDLYIMTD